MEILPVDNLKQVIDFLNEENEIRAEAPVQFEADNFSKYTLDFSEVKGQENAKRAIEIAAARCTQLSYASVRLGSRENYAGKENTNNFARFNI